MTDNNGDAKAADLLRSQLTSDERARALKSLSERVAKLADNTQQSYLKLVEPTARIFSFRIMEINREGLRLRRLGFYAFMLAAMSFAVATTAFVVDAHMHYAHLRPIEEALLQLPVTSDGFPLVSTNSVEILGLHLPPLGRIFYVFTGFIFVASLVSSVVLGRKITRHNEKELSLLEHDLRLVTRAEAEAEAEENLATAKKRK